jgi:hypothetical protein
MSNEEKPKIKEEKKVGKEKKSEVKKSKYGLSKETLERILETKVHKEVLPKKDNFHDEEFPEEELINSSNEMNLSGENKKRRTSVSLEAVNEGERNLGTLVHSGWQNRTNSSGENGTGSGFEYISKNSEENSEGKKYQSYEVNPNIKTLKPEEAASEWSKDFTKARNVKFVQYEQNSSGEPKYEKFFTPKNLSESEMKNLHEKKFRDFEFQEKKLNYYEEK